MKQKPLCNRNDIGLLLAVAALAAGIFLWNLLRPAPQNGEVVVAISGREAARFPLDKELVWEIDGVGGENTLSIADGRAEILAADCPDGICVRHRPIGKTGESILCLPHQVSVTIENAGESEVDLAI